MVRRVGRITKVTPGCDIARAVVLRSWYTRFASNTTVVVRLLWFYLNSRLKSLRLFSA
jgi:hypothetical protein